MILVSSFSVNICFSPFHILEILHFRYRVLFFKTFYWIHLYRITHLVIFKSYARHLTTRNYRAPGHISHSWEFCLSCQPDQWRAQCLPQIRAGLSSASVVYVVGFISLTSVSSVFPRLIYSLIDRLAAFYLLYLKTLAENLVSDFTGLAFCPFQIWKMFWGRTDTAPMDCETETSLHVIKVPGPSHHPGSLEATSSESRLSERLLRFSDVHANPTQFLKALFIFFPFNTLSRWDPQPDLKPANGMGEGEAITQQQIALFRKLPSSGEIDSI